MPNLDQMLKAIASNLEEFERGLRSAPGDLHELKIRLANLLNAPVYDETKREYVPSDSLAVFYTAEGQSLQKTDVAGTSPVLVVFLRFSWVTPYVMLDWKRTVNGREWQTLGRDQLPAKLGHLSDEVARFLDAQGYQVLSGAILEQTLPDRASELDDSPLTVHEGVFSALD